MKIIVCILIVLLSAVVGNGFRTDIKRRCESLEALNIICRKIQSEISFRLPTITELVLKYSTDSRCGSLFGDVHTNMKKGFPDAWRESVKKWAKSVDLTVEEADTVMLLESLGGTDAAGQRLLLSSVGDRLASHAESERNELNTKGKMLFSCSMLAGLALVILII